MQTIVQVLYAPDAELIVHRLKATLLRLTQVQMIPISSRTNVRQGANIVVIFSDGLLADEDLMKTFFHILDLAGRPIPVKVTLKPLPAIIADLKAADLTSIDKLETVAQQLVATLSRTLGFRLPPA